jgi:hypothetical protein
LPFYRGSAWIILIKILKKKKKKKKKNLQMNATVRMEVVYHNKDEYLLESKTRFINK